MCIQLMVSSDDEYYYYGFDNYVPKTQDPGPWMLIGVCIYSIFCVLILPVLVIVGDRWDAKLLDRNKRDDEVTQVDNPSSFDSRNPAEPEVEGIELELDEDTNLVAIVDLKGSSEQEEGRTNPTPGKALSAKLVRILILSRINGMYR